MAEYQQSSHYGLWQWGSFDSWKLCAYSTSEASVVIMLCTQPCEGAKARGRWSRSRVTVREPLPRWARRRPPIWRPPAGGWPPPGPCASAGPPSCPESSSCSWWTPTPSGHCWVKHTHFFLFKRQKCKYLGGGSSDMTVPFESFLRTRLWGFLGGLFSQAALWKCQSRHCNRHH